MLSHSQGETHHISGSKPAFNRNASLSHFPVSAPSVKTAAKNSDSLEPLFLDFFRTLAAINEKTTVDEVQTLKIELIVEIPGMGTTGSGRFRAADGGQWEANKPLRHRPYHSHETRT